MHSGNPHVKKLILPVISILLLSLSPAVANLSEDADAAYQRHDYPAALRMYRELAAQGNVGAQFCQ
jgi:hypothetical protein